MCFEEECRMEKMDFSKFGYGKVADHIE